MSDKSDKNIYDKRGIPIMPGDVVKVYNYIHNRSGRRYKYYMYKHARAVHERGGVRMMSFSHLNLADSIYYMKVDGEIHEDMEIVQGYEGAGEGQDYRYRPRKEAA